MCTVSFYRNKDQIIITSNRDENVNRPLAMPPIMEYVNGIKLYFPKDPLAGGTWFVMNERHNVFVLLNGAKSKHVSQPPYRLSRGIILIEISSALDFQQKWSSIDLSNIEPFTVIAMDNSRLYKLIWNGEIKEITELSNNKPQIWSSATLYEPEIIESREKWFEEFILYKNQELSDNDLIDFHTNAYIGDAENGLIINRNKTMLTKNVTQLVLEKGSFKLSHFDLIKKTKHILNEA